MSVKLDKTDPAVARVMQRLDGGVGHGVIAADDQREVAGLQSPAHCLVGFADSPVRPAATVWNKELGEFVLPYEEVRKTASPEKTLLDFLQTTYEAAARNGNWDIEGLARTFPR